MSHVLYLGSKSKSRQQLLRDADIPFVVLKQDSDECAVELEEEFDRYVLAIAQEKMKHVELPSPETTTKTIFVLTADSLAKGLTSGEIFGKPKDRADAKRMLRKHREEETLVTTACCLHLFTSEGSTWRYIDKREWCTSATLSFHIEEELLDTYFARVPLALHACGAAVIEGYGHNFLKRVNGSYAAILGLPLFELRQALNELGFWQN